MAESHALPILAVLGPSRSRPELDRVAERVGAEAARAGWVVLTGGGPGVMEAACRGAVATGGLTVGILPGATPSRGYPNPFVRVPVFTGAGSARNAFNVLSARACVAIGGGAGTLSEIALALKAGVPVLAWASWGLTPPEGVATAGLAHAATVDDLLTRLRALLAGDDRPA